MLGLASASQAQMTNQVKKRPFRRGLRFFVTSANQAKKGPSRRGGGRFFLTCRGFLLGPASAFQGGGGCGREDYVQCAAARLQEQNGSLLHMDSFGAIPRVERNVLACPTLKEPTSL